MISNDHSIKQNGIRHLRRTALAVSLVASVICVGCGGDGRPALVQCTGTVQMDGKPLEGATVSFQQMVTSNASSEGSFLRPSAGLTDANGNFTLGTYSLDDGIPKGEYGVAIVKNEPAKAIPPGMSTESLPPEYSKMRWITPRKYSEVKTSGLTAKVTASGLSPNTFELKSLAKQEIE